MILKNQPTKSLKYSQKQKWRKEIYMLSTIVLLYLVLIIGCPVWIRALVITELVWKVYRILCCIYNAGKEAKR